MKYIAKPEIVEAVQYQRGVSIFGAIERPDGSAVVHAAVGKVLLQPGDYVVSGAGGVRVMSAAKFEAGFEKIERPSAEPEPKHESKPEPVTKPVTEETKKAAKKVVKKAKK